MKKIAQILGSLMLLLLFITNPLSAQEKYAWDWNGPNDDLSEGECKEKYTILDDNDGDTGDHTVAVEALAWLLEKNPTLHPNLFIKGSRVYKALVEETEGEEKTKYQDATINIYDQWSKSFPKDADHALNEKGLVAFTYKQTQAAEYPNLQKLYKSILDTNKEKTFSYNVSIYIYLSNVLRSAERINNDDVLSIYEEVVGLAEKAIADSETDPTEVDGWKSAQGQAEDFLAKWIDMSCTFILDKFIPKVEANPDDLALTEKILGRMIKSECLSKESFTDSTDTFDEANYNKSRQEFLKLAKKLVESEPNYSRVRFLYKWYLRENNLAEAEKYLLQSKDLATEAAQKEEVTQDIVFLKLKRGKTSEAIAIVEEVSDPAKRAKFYLYIANQFRAAGDKISARSYALKAAPIDAYTAYTMIGDLYLSSHSQCKGSNAVESKAFAIAAYNAYNKAGNSAKAAQAQKYFPTKTDIFTHSMGGKAVAVPCWIGETVTIPNL